MTTATTRDNRFVSNGDGRSAGTDSGAPGAASADQSAAPKKSRFKSKKFILSIVGVLVIGGGAYKFLAPHPVPPPAGGDVVSLDATTLNLTGGHYLKVAISVQLVKGKASATDFFTSNAAELTIDEFSNRTVTQLSTNAEREKLTADLLTKIKAAYPGKVFDVFLTQFVTQ